MMQNVVRKLSVKRSCAVLVLVLFAGDAHALITQRIKTACRNDYFAHCSQHAVGSSSLRSCMRRSQDLLSKTCLKALVDDGEVSKEDVKRYKSRKPR